MITANDALTLLHKIGCTSISIEEDYNCSVDVDLIDVANFENCEAIAQIIANAVANS